MKNLRMHMLGLALQIAFTAQAQTEREVIAAVSLQQLKTIYLRCAEASSNVVLDRSTASHCSVVAEVLRERGFDGSFERMLAWWNQARAAAPDGSVQGSDAATTSRLR